MLGERAVCVHAGRYAEQAAGSVQRIRRPFAADALDHPVQDRPQITIHERFIEWFECRDRRMNFHAAREWLATASDEDQRIDGSGWRLQVAGPGEADAVEIEHAREERAKLGIVAQSILCQHKSQPHAVERWFRHDTHRRHAWPCRNSTMRAAISGPESSCRK